MNSVIKGASYVLVHTPDMVLYNGTTQTTERVVNPDSEYLKAVPEHLRSYEEAVSYWPNLTYIGNAHPDELAEIEFPYYDKKKEGAERYGKYGEIMPEEEFLLLVQACDMFEVVRLDKAFVEKYKEDTKKHLEDLKRNITTKEKCDISLSTVHASKGLEYEKVILAEDFVNIDKIQERINFLENKIQICVLMAKESPHGEG